MNVVRECAFMVADRYGGPWRTCCRLRSLLHVNVSDPATLIRVDDIDGHADVRSELSTCHRWLNIAEE